jgi:putative Holliday junction resolvase
LKEIMKTVALDVGDVWTGSAISDELGITARPYKTVKSTDLISFLHNLIEAESIDTIVVGYPKTMGGAESEQTKKVVSKKDELKSIFPQVTWVLWDERLSSKQASNLKKSKNKDDKIASHSVAAAIILTNYLMYASIKRVNL